MRLTKGSLNGLLTSCVITAFYNTLLKERYGGRKDEEEEVSSYWMTVRKREDVSP
jgi:hypothetical protein